MGSKIDVYIDYMGVKSKKEPGHLQDLAKVFVILKTHQQRLNAVKCVFGVSSDKFLGHLVTMKAIEAHSDQIMAIQDLENP